MLKYRQRYKKNDESNKSSWKQTYDPNQ
jgi:hypothetical protein